MVCNIPLVTMQGLQGGTTMKYLLQLNTSDVIAYITLHLYLWEAIALKAIPILVNST